MLFISAVSISGNSEIRYIVRVNMIFGYNYKSKSVLFARPQLLVSISQVNSNIPDNAAPKIINRWYNNCSRKIKYLYLYTCINKWSKMPKMILKCHNVRVTVSEFCSTCTRQQIRYLNDGESYCVYRVDLK